MFPQPKDFIPAIQAYAPGKPIEEVQREYNLESVIKLASNENPIGPSPLAVKAMRAAAAQMHRYPDGNGFYLKQALAEKHRVRPENIILGNGSDEITDMIAMAYVRPANNIVFSQHDFISYKLAAMMVGAKFREVPLRHWRADTEAMLQTIDANTRLVCLANPSNPIGTMVERPALRDFLGRVPSTTLVLLDEAYFEYVTARSYPDGLKFLKKHPNLIVTRTFSKAYGLAGLRIGYGFAHPEIIANFDRVRPPFNANRMAQEAALAALEDHAHIRRAIETNQTGRKRLEAAFDDMGLERIPSHTNFILVDTARSGAAVTEALLGQGVIVRPMGGYSLPRHIRVTIGRPGENRRLIGALKRALKNVPEEK